MERTVMITKSTFVNETRFFVCEYCEKRFTSLGLLYRHRADHFIKRIRSNMVSSRIEVSTCAACVGRGLIVKLKTF